MKVYNNPLDIPIPPAIYENTVEAAYRLGVINAQATLLWEKVTTRTKDDWDNNWDGTEQYVVFDGKSFDFIECFEGIWSGVACEEFGNHLEIDLYLITHRIKITAPEGE